MLKLPPAPVGTPFGSYTWADWYQKIRFIINDSQIDHNSLQNLQGGAANQYYHLTSAEYTALSLGFKQNIYASVNLAAGGALTATYTISVPVNTAKTVINHLGYTGESCTVTLTNSTTVTVKRATNTVNVTVNFEIIEYN